MNGLDKINLLCLGIGLFGWLCKMIKDNKKKLKKFKNFYGAWILRFGELAGIFGLFTSGMTFSWVVQNILRDSFSLNVPIYQILLVGVVLFVLFAWLLDYFELLGAKEEAIWERNRYAKRFVKHDIKKG